MPWVHLPIALVAVSVGPVVHSTTLPEIEAVLSLVLVAIRKRLHAPPVSLVIMPPVPTNENNPFRG